MSSDEKVTRSQLEVALDVLETYSADVIAAIALLRRIEATKHRADLAAAAATEILAREAAKADQHLRERLGIDAPSAAAPGRADD